MDELKKTNGGESGSWPASLPEGKAVARQGQGSGAGADARIHYRDRRRAGHVEVPRDWTTPGAPPSLLSPDFVAGSGRPSTAVKNPVTARPGAHAARSSGRHLAVNGVDRPVSRSATLRAAKSCYVHFCLFFFR